jgi:hypothetical protein
VEQVVEFLRQVITEAQAAAVEDIILVVVRQVVLVTLVGTAHRKEIMEVVGNQDIQQPLEVVVEQLLLVQLAVLAAQDQMNTQVMHLLLHQALVVITLVAEVLVAAVAQALEALVVAVLVLTAAVLLEQQIQAVAVAALVVVVQEALVVRELLF